MRDITLTDTVVSSGKGRSVEVESRFEWWLNGISVLSVRFKEKSVQNSTDCSIKEH